MANAKTRRKKRQQSLKKRLKTEQSQAMPATVDIPLPPEPEPVPAKDKGKEDDNVKEMKRPRPPPPKPKGSYCSSDNSQNTDTATDDDPSSPPPPPPPVTKGKRSVKTYVGSRHKVPATGTIQVTPMETESETMATATTAGNALVPLSSITFPPAEDSRLLFNYDQFSQLSELCLRNKRRTCVAPKCEKPANVKCPTCETLQYCTDKHRRTAYKCHEMSCQPYRIIETTALGRHAIAARNIEKGRYILTDEPMVHLPSNAKSAESGAFPDNYCVACFTMHEDPRKIRLCDCMMPLCANRDLCEISIQRQVKDVFSNYTNVGHVECEKIRLAQEAHMKEEAKELEELQLDFKPEPLVIDQSIVWMIRMAHILETTEKHNLKEMFDCTTQKLPPRSKDFIWKLRFFREKIYVTEKEISDDTLHGIYLEVMKHGRIIGKDVVSFYQRNAIEFADDRHWKGVFALLPAIHHSCVPNAIVHSAHSHTIGVHALQPLKKGDVISICFDERSLYFPTFKRREYLMSEFGITCKCKRCMSPTELDTYFSSFPCSNCGPGKRLSQGHISSTNPNNILANWLCTGCKKQCNALKVFHLIQWLNNEVDGFIKCEDVFGLNSWLKYIVENKFVHWNNFIVWDACVKMFKLLWSLLKSNDFHTSTMFENGEEFRQAADVIINLSGIFQPNTYMEGLVMPLRLAAIIKLYELADKLSANEISLQKLEAAVTSIYHRADDTHASVPLYKRKVLKEDEYNRIHHLEVKLMYHMYAATKAVSGSASGNLNLTKRNAPKLDQFIASFVDPGESFDDDAMFYEV